MDKTSHEAPSIDPTLDGESLTARSVQPPIDKTENLDESQDESSQHSLTQAPSVDESLTEPPSRADSGTEMLPSQTSVQESRTEVLDSQSGTSRTSFTPSSSQLEDTLMPTEERSSAFSSLEDRTAPLTPSVAPTLGPSTEMESAPGTAHAPAPSRSEYPSVPGYTILKEVGRGGMGVVYKARQAGLNRIVALKMILHGKGSKRERDHFRLEAEVIAKLQHSNIVQIYEIGEHGSFLYFSLEFVESGCLADAMARKLPSPGQSARIVQKLAEGMDLAHSQGIIHRDLKPANVLLGGKRGAPLDELVPKITDFGLAKQIEEGDSKKHQHGGIMGTPSYMPPEQAEGRNHQVGPPADIYALGAVLYDLLTGKPPFRGSTAVETLQMVCTVPPHPPANFNPAVPHDLQVICLKCLEKEPEKRYRSARELANDLKAFLEGAPISARSYTKWERAHKWVRRRPTTAGLLLVSVLALLVLAFGGVVIARQEAALAREEERRRLDAEDHARVETALRQSEQQEKERAEANLGEARNAVGELTALGHKRLSSVPHVEGIRRELLEKALAYNERFLAINGERPGQKQEVARSLLRAGEIQEMLGKPKSAEKSYQKALTTFAALAEAEPKNPDHRRELAMTWNDLAILQASHNQQSAAEKSYTVAIALKTALMRESSSATDRRNLANSLMSRGGMWLMRNDTKKAEQDYQAALDQLSALPREESLEDISRLQTHLGALWIENNPQKAAVANRTAIDGWKALIKQSPEPRFRHELATVYSNEGTRASGQKKPKEAEAYYEEARGLLTTLTNEYRSVVAYREMLANVYHNLGKILHDQGRHQDSSKIWRAELPLCRRLAEDFPERVDYRQKLGQVLNELGIALANTNRLGEVEGLWQEAIAIQEKLVTEKPKDEEYWKDLAETSGNVVTLLGSPLVVLSPRLETACRQLVNVQVRRVKAFPDVSSLKTELGQARYLLAASLLKLGKSDDALKQLEEAATEGFRDRNALKTQPEWEPLRKRPAFQKLLD
jgi:tetratricopeptide (TPR) repeat protein/tRNA A-37 threonylcarbamoyl transferase component Bud32